MLTRDELKEAYLDLRNYAIELEDRVEHLEALLKHSRESEAELEASVKELEEERDAYDAEAEGYLARINDLQARVIRLQECRKANLKWIAGLVGAAYTLAGHTGAGEEALEELEDLRDIVTETVEHMLKKED
jgi:hypothetical protein